MKTRVTELVNPFAHTESPSKWAGGSADGSEGRKPVDPVAAYVYKLTFGELMLVLEALRILGVADDWEKQVIIENHGGGYSVIILMPKVACGYRPAAVQHVLDLLLIAEKDMDDKKAVNPLAASWLFATLNNLQLLRMKQAVTKMLVETNYSAKLRLRLLAMDNELGKESRVAGRAEWQEVTNEDGRKVLVDFGAGVVIYKESQQVDLTD